jgi:prepilin-type N-terminal cleavage/methylation domain-containing protein
MKKESHKKGFTIIEVVLVLAIAGLIFLMVFVAFPALQRSQRDTRRREDLGRISTALSQYQANNGGKLPDTSKFKANTSTLDHGAAGNATALVSNYLNGMNATENEFVDPDGTYYGVTIEVLGKGKEKTLSTVEHIVYIETYAKCNGEKAVRTDNKNDYAVMYRLESAGTYCQDSQ